MTTCARVLLAGLLIGLIACGDAAAPAIDAGDSSVDVLDQGVAPPLAGFGDISGECDVLDDGEWSVSVPFSFRNAIDFGSAAFDENALSVGGKQVWDAGNLGGNSRHSEVFSFELLYRCELATLLKTEGDVEYIDDGGKKTDLLVMIDGRKVGVSVTRAVSFPRGQPYSLAEATDLLDRKLDDILLSAANAKSVDAWERSVLHVIAYDAQHADVVAQAYQGLDAATRDVTILLITVTDGLDDYIY